MVPSPPPFGLGRNGYWPFRGSQLPRALPFVFSLCCPLNDLRRAAHSFFKIGRLFSFSFPSSSPHSSPSLDGGNAHLNPGPIFSCSVCAGNVTRQGRSMQCCTCTKWVLLKCHYSPLNSELLAALTPGAAPSSASLLVTP